MTEPVEQRFHALGNQIQNLIKPVITAIIGVWYVCAFEKEIEARWCAIGPYGLQIEKIPSIHGEYMIEPFEIVWLGLARAEGG